MSSRARRIARPRVSESHRRPVGCEPLECRTLFSVHFDLNGGVLAITEDFAGVDNWLTFDILDNGNLQIHELINENFLANNNLFNAGWVIDGNTITGPQNAISAIVMDLTDGTDRVEVHESVRPMVIQPSVDSTTLDVQIGDHTSASGAQAVTAPVTVDGSKAGFLGLSIDDNLNTQNVDPTITSTQILNFAGAPVNFTPAPQGNDPNPRTLVFCGTGTSTSGIIIDQDPANPTAITYQVDAHGPGTLGIESLNANSAVNVQGQSGGTEAVHIGNFGSLDGVLGQIFLGGNAGSVSVNVDGRNDPIAHTYDVASNGGLMRFKQDGRTIAQMNEPSTGFTLQTGPAENTINLDLFNSTAGFAAAVECGNTDDTINVNRVTSNVNLNVAGGGGTDHVALRAGNISGAINLANSAGRDAVTVDGSDASSPQAISVTDTHIAGIGAGTYTFGNLTSLDVTGGSAFDNFTVTPSSAVTISVDGGPSSGASPDRLQVTTTDVTGVALSLDTNSSGKFGSYTFSNRHAVNFSRFDTVTPAFGDLTGTIFNQQTGAAVASAAVTVDTNNNNAADQGEPSTTTDSSGLFNFQGLPTGTFNLLITSAGLQPISTPAATVAAGVVAPPLLIPLIPTPSPEGPDLVATITLGAAGKTGLIKPKARVKITNNGAPMASAAQLQITLYASADGTLDAGDANLLAFTTPALLLKTNGTKTFPLTGATLTSLARASYFLLASVDSANAIAESDESNNVAASASAIPLAPPVIDLTGQFVLKKQPSKFKPFPVTLQIQNLGTLPATGPIAIDLLASTDNILDNADLSLAAGVPVVAHAQPGRSQNAKVKLSLASLPAGTYYLIAKLNSTNAITESDTSNNTVISATTIVLT
jgi:hypothetical protein